MAINDYLAKKNKKKDLKQYEELIQKAIQARRKIETGFIDLAESIFDLHRKKLYKIKYQTFGEFCEQELGFSRQTIYIYINILKLINRYPNYFPREKAIDFGHKKMRYITEGVSAIDKKYGEDNSKEPIIIEILNYINPDMASTEIEAYIEDKIDEL